MLNKEWNIRKLFVDAAGKIAQVEFLVTFTSPNYPGQSMGWGDVAAIPMAGLDQLASHADIATAIMTLGPYDWQAVEQQVGHDLSMAMMRAGTTLVDLDPLPVEEFPPLHRLEFWLLALTIDVTKASVAAHIEAMPEGTYEEIQTKEEARLYFADATIYRREDPFLNALAVAEGVTAEQLDSLWKWGAPAIVAARTSEAAA